VERRRTASRGPGGLLPPRWRKWAFWGLAAVLWAWFLFGDEGLLRQVARWREIRVLEARLAEVRSRNAALEAEIEALRDDDLAIEAAVRTELDWQRPGERVFVVGDDDPLADARVDTPGSAP